MSLFKFGDFETEVDFTDADFLTDLEYAQEKLSEDAAKVPKTGKTAELFRAQCQCYFNFLGKERMKLCSKGEQVINYV